MGILRSEDGDGLTDLMVVFTSMILHMLATLEKEEPLKPDSEVKNLASVMALYTLLSSKKGSPLFLEVLESDSFAETILAYATKHNIVLQSPVDIQEIISTLQPGADKVELADPASRDPWGWGVKLKVYKKEQETIGGDSFDISTYTPAERRDAAFDNKDPFTRTMIKNIKEGKVMWLC
jgi:hypothetical protein